MSQLSIQGTDDLVTLSLRKFSYSTTNDGASIQWTHSLDPDKIAVFDYVTVRDIGGLLTRKSFLKVVVGGKTLVGVDQNLLGSWNHPSVFGLHCLGTFPALV